MFDIGDEVEITNVCSGGEKGDRGVICEIDLSPLALIPFRVKTHRGPMWVRTDNLKLVKTE
jgi:hypothetical protein